MNTSTVTRQALAAVRALLALTVLLGVAYPLAVTGVARALTGPADGSLVERGGRVVGSRLLGQATTAPEWFHARPSASEYGGDTSGGSNYGQGADEQRDAVAARRAALLAANPQATGEVPDDALTASASGLDPDVSLAYALWQAPRVAAARHLPVADVQRIVREHVTSPALGVLGQERVNVLELNLALADRG